MKKLVVLLILLSLASSALFASIEDDIHTFGKVNGKNYIRPFFHSMAANLNTGWFNSAETGLLHFGLTVNSMFAFIPNDAKTFVAVSPDTSLYDPDELESATCFGNAGATFTSSTAPDLVLPNGKDLKALPFLVPQAELGLPGGFGIQFRFLPKTKITRDVGDVSLIGVGVKNEISRQFPLLPIAIAFQASYQKFEMGDVADLNSIFVNLHASKSLIFFPVTLFGGIGLENSTFKANYDKDGTSGSIEFEIKTENELRFNLGARLRIMLVDFLMEYSMGKYNSARAGIGFSL